MTIKLVTFDVFGTLLDWRAYVETACPGGYGRFLEIAGSQQQPEKPYASYEDILYDVHQQLKPGATTEASKDFSFSIGSAPRFADWRALHTLRQRFPLAAVSNSSFRHQWDAMQNLNVSWDAQSLAEEWHAYKPHRAAWDRIVDDIQKKTGIYNNEWLHVSAYHDFDLAPAKERGLKIAFIPRPGGSTKADIEALCPDFHSSDLWDLTRQLFRACGAPLCYVVAVTPKDSATCQEFLEWMAEEHGPELLTGGGCRDFRVTSCDQKGDLFCEYTFADKVSLQNYFAGRADELRQKGLSRFGDRLKFSRSVRSIALAGTNRAGFA